MTSWTVTLKTGANAWSTITVEATDHIEALKIARRFLGNHPVTRIV